MNNKSLNKLSTITLQEQLYQELLSKIKDGSFKSGEMITSELKLSEEYGVSRITVRNSIQQLVDEGYLVKRRGKGTFVKDKEYVLINDEKSAGFSEYYIWLKIDLKVPVFSMETWARRVVESFRNIHDIADFDDCDYNAPYP